MDENIEIMKAFEVESEKIFKTNAAAHRAATAPNPLRDAAAKLREVAELLDQVAQDLKPRE